MRFKGLLVIFALSFQAVFAQANVDKSKRNNETSQESSWSLYAISGAIVAAGTILAGYFTRSMWWPSKPSHSFQRSQAPDLSIDAMRRHALDGMKAPSRPYLGGGSFSEAEMEVLSVIAQSSTPQTDVIDRRGTDQRFLRLHDTLMANSATYREMVRTIIQRSGAGTIRILPQARDSFEFAACWRADLPAIMITDPDARTDAEIGGLIVMEMTNALQETDFQAVHARAIQGHYEQHHPSDPAQHYALDSEAIEQRGIQRHRTIIEELISSTRGRIGHDWHRYQGYSGSRAQDFSAYIREEGSQSHIEYYKRYYNQDLMPQIRSKRESEVSSRIRKHGGTPVLPPIKAPSKGPNS